MATQSWYATGGVAGQSAMHADRLPPGQPLGAGPGGVGVGGVGAGGVGAGGAPPPHHFALCPPSHAPMHWPSD